MQKYLLKLCLFVECPYGRWGHIIMTQHFQQYNYFQGFVIVGWVLAITLSSFAVFGSYDIGRLGGGWEMTYRIVFRDIFALSVAWVIFACSTGYGGNSIIFFIPNIIGTLFITSVLISRTLLNISIYLKMSQMS